jgi:hypothetical protein
MPSLWLVTTCVFLVARPLSGQITVVAIRDLTFGTVIVGVPTAVPPDDPVRSGQFEISGSRPSDQLVFQFTLPNQLAGPAGATMPISFGATDALASSIVPASRRSFDPRAPATFRVNTRNPFSIFIGGTVAPPAGQRAGTYTGLILLTVILL